MLSSSGAFDVLPDEVIKVIFLFCDIPSLGHIAQLNSRSVIAQLACDDETWAHLVEKRFRISTSKSRPVLHGGHSWKQSYFSMSRSIRIPRCRYTGSQKAVFAKGRPNQRKSNQGSSSPVRLWVLIGHTENCKTRTIQHVRASTEDSERNNERFIELYLCLQNVKSGDGDVTVDVLESTLSLMGSTECSDPLISRVSDSSSPSLQPRVLFHDASESTNNANLLDYNITRGIKLRPFDIAVVSLHFSCPEIYETDFLARAVSLHAPVRKLTTSAEKGNGGAAATSYAGITQNTQTSAFFIPEHDVWNYYMELPGNCLTLVDRFQLARE